MTAMRTRLAIAAGKAAAALARRLRRGGTALPGAVARRIQPRLLTELTAQLPRGVVLVAGTNGKTTTSRMLADILSAAGLRLIHNRAGANLTGGLTSVALAAADSRGRIDADIALFETDEAALPQVIRETQPRLVLLLNLFRDQLDRYGEIDTIIGRWRTALQLLPAEAIVLLNADDPAIADLGNSLQAQVRYFGLADLRHAAGRSTHIADSQFCRRCGTRYDYATVFYAHVGHYRCPQCGNARPQPHFALEQLELHGTAASSLTISAAGQPQLSCQLPLPGLYNAQNALAAAAAGLLLGATAAQTAGALAAVQAAFGRIERIPTPLDGRQLLLVLIKNPVGASESVRMVTQAGHGLQLLIAINDRFADGTDVSWLWDAEFEPLAATAAAVTVSGTRAADMALRLDYADVPRERMTLIDDLAAALDHALAAVPPGGELLILPTYTALLELRSLLARRGWAAPFWQA
jgi:lipid II isoglutaminyl synthase (glutamine-hydrolysing)